jgi:hypothetical protein
VSSGIDSIQILVEDKAGDDFEAKTNTKAVTALNTDSAAIELQRNFLQFAKLFTNPFSTFFAKNRSRLSRRD